MNGSDILNVVKEIWDTGSRQTDEVVDVALHLADDHALEVLGRALQSSIVDDEISIFHVQDMLAAAGLPAWKVAPIISIFDEGRTGSFSLFSLRTLLCCLCLLDKSVASSHSEALLMTIFDHFCSISADDGSKVFPPRHLNFMSTVWDVSVAQALDLLPAKPSKAMNEELFVTVGLKVLSLIHDLPTIAQHRVSARIDGGNVRPAGRDSDGNMNGTESTGGRSRKRRDGCSCVIL
uniref:Uncharacterized protein n=1 Tax=Palpitomonas bilix TaxID=652834 RepID=A0A7S3LTQ9_9EUKA|mmetsp:Transcript_45653/g.117987  ORF Transcript_45653/g.117987 Transcript_45653/m.117987 type:complete len:235 (+) Transcript_45653:180-884(+)